VVTASIASRPSCCRRGIYPQIDCILWDSRAFSRRLSLCGGRTAVEVRPAEQIAAPPRKELARAQEAGGADKGFKALPAEKIREGCWAREARACPPWRIKKAAPRWGKRELEKRS
jgi:hypothetical protein